MRTAFINELIAQARVNPDVFLVVGDLGFSVVEPFAEEFPDRFLNAGVAEQNMTGVAAGLASEGYHVFTYSIANFPVLRCFEQIRNDIAYHNVPVTIVSVGGGMAYGSLGYSHHAVQDLAVMRTLPHMTVLAPGDPGETRECVQWLVRNPRPSYLRLGKAGEPALHDVRGIDDGALLIREGNDRTALVSTGAMLGVALEAAAKLMQNGRTLPVFSLPFLHPARNGHLSKLSACTEIFALEEHTASGGLASLLREQLPHVSIRSCSLDERTAGLVGSQEYLREQAGLDADSIARLVLNGDRLA